MAFEEELRVFAERMQEISAAMLPLFEQWRRRHERLLLKRPPLEEPMNESHERAKARFNFHAAAYFTGGYGSPQAVAEAKACRALGVEVYADGETRPATPPALAKIYPAAMAVLGANPPESLLECAKRRMEELQRVRDERREACERADTFHNALNRVRDALHSKGASVADIVRIATALYDDHKTAVEGFDEMRKERDEAREQIGRLNGELEKARRELDEARRRKTTVDGIIDGIVFERAQEIQQALRQGKCRWGYHFDSNTVIWCNDDEGHTTHWHRSKTPGGAPASWPSGSSKAVWPAIRWQIELKEAIANARDLGVAGPLELVCESESVMYRLLDVADSLLDQPGFCHIEGCPLVYRPSARDCVRLQQSSGRELARWLWNIGTAPMRAVVA